jgi:hypothetical protein
VALGAAGFRWARPICSATEATTGALHRAAGLLVAAHTALILSFTGRPALGHS